MSSAPDAAAQAQEALQAPLVVIEVVVTALPGNYVQETYGDTTVVRLQIPPVPHP